jgi:hypothetical protein
MQKSARLVSAVLIAVSGIYFGLKLAVFAEKDDSPGGVMIGVAIMFSALSLGLWIALRQTKANPG